VDTNDDKSQVVTDRNSYLCIYNILCCSEKRLGTQALFYPFGKFV